MRALRGIVVIAALLLSAGAAWSAQPPEQPASEPLFQELLTGDQKVLTPGYLIGNIAIADPRVCNFRVLPERKAVLLVAAGEGHTTLTIFDQRGNKRDDVAIEVISREFAKLRDDLKALVAAYPGVEVTSLGRRLTLTGTVTNAEQLNELQRVAGAAGNVTSLVTLRDGGGYVSGSPSPAAAPRFGTTPTPMPPAVRPSRPEPSVPVPPGTPTPVPLDSSPPAAGSASPVAFPPITASGSIGRPVATSIDYNVELVQSPASAPPPDVLGPIGTVLFKTRLSVPFGTLVRQFVSAGTGQAPARDAMAAAAVVGLSIGVHPAIEPDGRIRTSVVVDTNLPVGGMNPAATPAWRRGVLEFVHARTQSLYLTERDLDAAFARDSAAAADLLGRSSAGGTQADARTTVEALGAMFRGASDARDAVKGGRESVLVIVVTPIDAATESRP